jgi:hypothetical protein
MKVMVGLARKEITHSPDVYYQAQDLTALRESQHCQDTPERRRNFGK